MSGIQRYHDQLAFYDILSYVLGAYQEVSFMKMNQARGEVFTCRDFLAELRIVYREIQVSRYQELLRVTKKQKTPLKKQRELALLLSPREKLQGDIPIKVFRDFVDYVRNRECEVLVVGSMGEEMFKSAFPERKFQTFELLYGGTFEEDLLSLSFLLEDYDVLSIFHGQFQSLLTQQSTKTTVDKVLSPEQIGGGSILRTSFLFEPDLVKVKEFFDAQFRNASLRQTVHESRLAQFASRARAMDEALQNTISSRKRTYRQLSRAKKMVSQKKQLSQLASVLWGSGV